MVLENLMWVGSCAPGGRHLLVLGTHSPPCLSPSHILMSLELSSHLKPIKGPSTTHSAKFGSDLARPEVIWSLSSLKGVSTPQGFTVGLKT